MNDNLVVAVDVSENGDTPCMIIGRFENMGFHTINMIQGEEATKLYHILCGEGKSKI